MTQSVLFLFTLPVFAIILMAGLLNPKREAFTRRKILLLVLLAAASLLLNFAVYFFLGFSVYRKCYLLLVQLPVFAGFWLICEYRGIKLLFTLLTTITLCTLPVETVVLARILTDGNPPAMLAGLLLSFFLVLLFAFRFLRPRYLFTLKYGENALFWKFCLIPVFYYLYCYLHTGYNFTRLHDLNHYFVNRLPELMILVFYLILPDIFKTTCEKKLLENRRDFMQVQLSSASEQIAQLRAAQHQSDIYRHDLRHHMNYLNTCLAKNRTEEASAYIQQIFEKIDRAPLVRYCSNEPINLILTSYAAKAKALDIAMDIRISKADFSRFQIMDICSLLSNGLENAVKACAQTQAKRHILLHIFCVNETLCLKLANSFGEEPFFENGIPVSFREGHGIGVKSMIYVVEKYRGIYDFSLKDGLFVFQMSI